MSHLPFPGRLLLAGVTVFFTGLTMLWGLIVPVVALAVAWAFAAILRDYWTVTPIEALGLITLGALTLWSEIYCVRRFFHLTRKFER